MENKVEVLKKNILDLMSSYKTAIMTVSLLSKEELDAVETDFADEFQDLQSLDEQFFSAVSMHAGE